MQNERRKNGGENGSGEVVGEIEGGIKRQGTISHQRQAVNK